MNKYKTCHNANSKSIWLNLNSRRRNLQLFDVADKQLALYCAGGGNGDVLRDAKPPVPANEVLVDGVGDVGYFILSNYTCQN